MMIAMEQQIHVQIILVTVVQERRNVLSHASMENALVSTSQSNKKFDRSDHVNFYYYNVSH